MPSAPATFQPGTTNGHHLANSMAGALTNGQTSSATLSNEECGIRDVWAHNMEDEFKTIRTIVQHYPYVAMDTEFPGVVARPIGSFSSNSDYLYQIMRVNINLLKIIQLGLTFMDGTGKTPPGCSTWQFNFKFNINDDMYAQESIDLLNNSGIQFKKHDEDGIDPSEFAVFLIGSGVVLSENICWLSFHSGYDFGYLLKILTDTQLPKKESDFFDLLRLWFPRVYDLKYLMKSTKDLKGGLQEVAEQLDLVRKGPQHQAGSDSLLTGETFFKLREMYFEDDIEEKRYSGFIYGLDGGEAGKFAEGEESFVYIRGHEGTPGRASGSNGSPTSTTTDGVSSTVVSSNGTSTSNGNGQTTQDGSDPSDGSVTPITNVLNSIISGTPTVTASS